jgi:plastocyanin
VTKRLLVMTAALGVVVLAACGGNSDTSAAGAGRETGGGGGSRSVVLRDIAFKPDKLSVKAGDTVTWRFQDKGIPHNVTAADGSFRSQTTDSGTFRHKFDAAGTFAYTCTVHPDTMKATVKVS